MREGGDGEKRTEPEAAEDPEAARREFADALAQAAVAEAVYEVLDEAQRAGVALPDGFAERMARAAARRAGAALRRLGVREVRKVEAAVVVEGEAGVRPIRKVFA